MDTCKNPFVGASDVRLLRNVTQWSRILLGNLIVAQLVKELTAFYRHKVVYKSSSLNPTLSQLNPFNAFIFNLLNIGKNLIHYPIKFCINLSSYDIQLISFPRFGHRNDI
jgi:hypothetical protein